MPPSHKTITATIATYSSCYTSDFILWRNGSYQLFLLSSIPYTSEIYWGEMEKETFCQYMERYSGRMKRNGPGHLDSRSNWNFKLVTIYSAKDGRSTVWTRQSLKWKFSRGYARSISPTFSWKIGDPSKKGLELLKLAKGTHIFHSEILFGNSTFQKIPFPGKISVWWDKINLSIYIPSEISGFFG